MKKLIAIFLLSVFSSSLVNAQVIDAAGLVLDVFKGLAGSAQNMTKVQVCGTVIKNIYKAAEMLECLKYELDLNVKLKNRLNCFEKLNFEFALLRYKASMTKLLVVGASAGVMVKNLMNGDNKNNQQNDPCDQMNQVLDDLIKTLHDIYNVNNIIRQKIMEEVRMTRLKNRYIENSKQYARRENI